MDAPAQPLASLLVTTSSSSYSATRDFATGRRPEIGELSDAAALCQQENKAESIGQSSIAIVVFLPSPAPQAAACLA